MNKILQKLNLINKYYFIISIYFYYVTYIAKYDVDLFVTSYIYLLHYILNNRINSISNINTNYLLSIRSI